MLKDLNFVPEEINPVTAYSYLLRQHPANRTINLKNLEDLSYRMKNGLWIPVPPGIIFGKSGYLLNGQHTLNAVLATNCTIICYVLYDLDDKLFPLLDLGRSRTKQESKSILSRLKKLIKS